ncbi:TIGR02594 family protein [Roseomonas hellenica]|uniref:TIGR02594 family protein n=1 Tax=Plastoroseomonas hellenica TaxID=2687306 RepID=A0ABS5EU51_9PROT|nr:TIGR02594 family protein [Plastoroseomonas hellenica]MBR0663480.1 TIGR02594 family protein [Plastoroseomonas hellenica]
MTFGSDSIVSLQRFLNGKLQPSPNLALDGVMGPQTREALQRYEEVRARVGTDGALIDAHLHRDHVWSGAPDGWDEAPGSQETLEAGGPHVWMAIAEGEIGVSEATGRGSHAAQIEAYRQAAGRGDGAEWSSAFVNWVLRKAGHIGTGSAEARSWIGWGMACEPRYGAVTVLRTAPGSGAGFHVGFLTSVQSSKVRLLGGSQNDKVKFANFPSARYEPIAYRWPPQ